jgi:hypothetical protein
MALVVYKYLLSCVGSNEPFYMDLPKHARILTVQRQHDGVVIWALVNTKDEITKRTFVALWTGREFPDDQFHLAYIGTIQFNDGDTVWHIFELRDLLESMVKGMLHG